MAKLGKHKAGKGCLYINKLDDVDRKVLRKLIEYSVEDAAQAPRGLSRSIATAATSRARAAAALSTCSAMGHHLSSKH